MVRQHSRAASVVLTDKILSKMGEGTFGRVLECWDRKNKDYCAIKVVRAIRKYRDAAMIEVMSCAWALGSELAIAGLACQHLRRPDPKLCLIACQQ